MLPAFSLQSRAGTYAHFVAVAFNSDSILPASSWRYRGGEECACAGGHVDAAAGQIACVQAGKATTYCTRARAYGLYVSMWFVGVLICVRTQVGMSLLSLAVTEPTGVVRVMRALRVLRIFGRLPSLRKGLYTRVLGIVSFLTHTLRSCGSALLASFLC